MAQFQSTSVTGSLTVTGQVIAQTLNVQQVTSSIVYSSGSNIFGNTLGNTQQFTGSVSVTGSLAVAGNINLNGASSFPTVGLLNRTSDSTLYLVSAATGFTLTDSSLNTMYNVTPTSHNWNISNSLKMKLDVSGSLGLGTTSPRGVLDISSGLRTGALSGLFIGADSDTTAGTRTNNTRKLGIIASPHYQNAIDSVFGISMDNQVSNNFIYIGGGYSGYTAATAIVFSTGGTTTTATGTERIRVTADGLTFNGDTAAANALDDYEEGTWTPNDASGAGLSFTVLDARYTKIGRQVQCFAQISYPSTANTNDAKIGGLPFTMATTTGGSYGAFLTYTNLGSNPTFLNNSNTTNTSVYTNAGAAITNVTLSAKQFRLVWIYEV